MASRYSWAPWGTWTGMAFSFIGASSDLSAWPGHGRPAPLPYYISRMPPSSKTPAPTVLLLDGHSLAYRAFFALAEADLRTTSGQPTNAVYGFTSMLIKAWQDHKSRHLAVAFDRGAPLERLAIRPEYKAQRQTPPDEFRQQVGLIREVLKVLQVPVFEMDNVDGVPGIGEKTAAKLIQTYGTLEEMFEHLDELPPKNRERLGEARTRLLENREFFRFRSREELAAHGAPVEILDVSARDLQMGRWDAAEVRRLFDSLEFRTLYERLGTDLPAAAPQGGLSAEAVEVASIDELQAAAREAARSGVVTLRVAGERSHPRSAPTSLALGMPGGARAGARVARLENLGGDPEAVWAAIREPLASARLATHASKDALLRLAAADIK